MKRGDVFSILRFEARRLLRWEYLAAGMAFLVTALLFMEFGGAKDVVRLVEVAGSWMMMGLGLGLWKGAGSVSLVSLLGRGLMLGVYWGIVSALVFGFEKWPGVVIWTLGLVLFLWFFYLSAVVVSVVVISKCDRCLWAVVMWISFVSLIPWLLDFFIQRFQLPASAVVVWPVSFFSYLAKGIWGGSTLAGFMTGIWVILVYLLLLVWGVFLGGGSRGYEEDEGRMAVRLGGLERGKFYFLHIRDCHDREKFVRYFESKGAIIVKKIDTSDLDRGVSLKAWLEFLSGIRGHRLDSLLVRLGDLGIQRRHLRMRLKSLSKELIMRAFLGLKLDLEGTMVVFDDFLDGCSAEFQDLFQTKIKEKMPDAVFIYIGARMYETALGKRFGTTAKMRFIAVDPAKVMF